MVPEDPAILFLKLMVARLLVLLQAPASRPLQDSQLSRRTLLGTPSRTPLAVDKLAQFPVVTVVNQYKALATALDNSKDTTTTDRAELFQLHLFWLPLFQLLLMQLTLIQAETRVYAAEP